MIMPIWECVQSLCLKFMSTRGFVMSRGDSGVSSLVTVQRGDTNHDLQLNQVTTDVLRRLFRVCTVNHSPVYVTILGARLYSTPS